MRKIPFEYQLVRATSGFMGLALIIFGFVDNGLPSILNIVLGLFCLAVTFRLYPYALGNKMYEINFGDKE